MPLSEVQEYLNSFLNYELQKTASAIDPQRFNSQRVEKLSQAIGSPHKKLKYIHVAGTNGKGSVCAFTASMLQKLGYTVGLYTSPHLYDYNERIRIFPQGNFTLTQHNAFAGSISNEELQILVEKFKPYIEEIQKQKELGELTFFEIYTVLALYYFAMRKTDFVVLETGLGGRLDATNIVDSSVCAITSIDLEHTQWLGKSIEEITREKAGIIKNKNQKVVIAPQGGKAQEVLQKRCQEFSIRPTVVGEDIRHKILRMDMNGQKFFVTTPRREYPSLMSPSLGRHQIINAATAIGIIESLPELNSVLDIERIQGGIENAFWPGRFEIVRKNPYIILDGAHNPAACKILVETLRGLLSRKRIIMVLGFSHDKDIVGMCKILNQAATEIILTKADHPRALALEGQNWAELFPHKGMHQTHNVKEAVEQAKQTASEEDVIVVAGSLFVAAEARKLCIN